MRNGLRALYTVSPGMGAGLLAVKSGFILINRIYQFFNNKLAEQRERDLYMSVGAMKD